MSRRKKNRMSTGRVSVFDVVEEMRKDSSPQELSFIKKCIKRYKGDRFERVIA